MAQCVRGHLRHHLRRCGIREMAVSGKDALFHRPRALGILLEKSFVMIGLNQEGVYPADGFHHLAGGEAEIGQHGKTAAIRAQNKTHRIGCIMWNRKWKNFNRSESKPRATGKKVPTGLDPRPFQVIGSEGIGKHRYPVFVHKYFQPLGVVAMLVSQKDA